MAGRAPKVCAHPGCYAVVPAGSFCEKHQKRDVDRRNSYQRGYTKKWARARLWYLAQHPLCVECLKRGKLVSATQVDHIQPHQGDMTLFWDSDNWQALCHSCHSRKTLAEQN